MVNVQKRNICRIVHSIIQRKQSWVLLRYRTLCSWGNPRRNAFRIACSSRHTPKHVTGVLPITQTTAQYIQKIRDSNSCDEYENFEEEFVNVHRQKCLLKHHVLNFVLIKNLEKAKFSLCLNMPWRHIIEWRCSSTILEFGTSWRWIISLATRPKYLPGEIGTTPTGIHWIGGWVGPRAGLEVVEKRKLLFLLGFEPRKLQSIARRFTEWAIPTPDYEFVNPVKEVVFLPTENQYNRRKKDKLK
jgi:hypothetical protein